MGVEALSAAGVAAEAGAAAAGLAPGKGEEKAPLPEGGAVAAAEGEEEEVWDPARDALDERLGGVLVEPNEGEDDDEKLPRNLHNAAELFLSTGKGRAAKRLQRCVQAFFGVVERKPDPSTVKAGRASVCWSCGFCGLPATAAASAPEPASASAPGEVCCRGCGASDTNFVQAVLADGVALPWLEPAPSSPSSAQRAEASDDEGEVAIEGLDDRLTSFQVLPNEGEAEHANFPRNLHNAMELLMHVGHLRSAQRLQRCTNAFLRLLEEGPRPGDATGRAHVCFDCGFCGLAAADGEAAPAAASASKAGKCGHCGDDSHTNFIDLMLPNGRQLPWMQRGQAQEAPPPQRQAVAGGGGRVKPNAPCDCGSGKKAKKCCHVGGL